jgi:hypothetical protein
MHIQEQRPQLDHMLRQTRMNLVNFSQMADTKAHILLSISAVLLSLSMTRLSEPHFTFSATTLILFLLITIFFALLTVIGKVKGFNQKKHSIHDPDYSPLFFGNFGDIPYDEYAQDFTEIMNDADKTYEIMIKDIYYAGTYLLKTKYKYIRLAYLYFFAGLIVSTAIYFIQTSFSR